MAIADIRRDYTVGHLDRADLDANPLAQFDRWFAEATKARTTGSRLRRFAIGIYKSFATLFGSTNLEANAMQLATVGADGKPSVRTVLLKGVDQRGFIFFTNYDSRKGRELTANPNASLVFYWPDLERQVCVAGAVTKVSRDESAKYFHSRPKRSQVAAVASKQSSPLPNRDTLESRMAQLESEFAQREVPIPDCWGGFALSPERIEFWQGRASRLHDRFSYTKQADGTWDIERLAP